MSIEEGNKIIAEFMGGVLCDYPDGMFPGEKGYQFPNPVYRTSPTWWNKHSLMYDKSWDWLMPVVEKIKAIPTKDGTELIKKIDQIVHSLCLIRIGITHKLCAEFFQWYNSQTLKPISNE
jgi:hypothetical protein